MGTLLCQEVSFLLLMAASRLFKYLCSSMSQTNYSRGKCFFVECDKEGNVSIFLCHIQTHLFKNKLSILIEGCLSSGDAMIMTSQINDCNEFFLQFSCSIVFNAVVYQSIVVSFPVHGATLCWDQQVVLILDEILELYNCWIDYLLSIWSPGRALRCEGGTVSSIASCRYIYAIAKITNTQ